MEYKQGDKIVVTEDFQWDSASFIIGMTGTVLKVHIRESRKILAIEWDHDDRSNFHSCGGLCRSYRGYNLDQDRCSIALASETEALGNPLPDDPRLRGIAIKIKQMETRFKNRQLQKLKDKESSDEVYKSVSLQAGVVVSSIPSSLTWSSTSSF